MKFKSQVYTAVSGSIGGITYAHNQGGMYARARATPTDPATQRQADIRQFMSDLNVLWNDVLSTAQRDAWNLYAQNVTLLNPFGDPINVSGIAMYQRTNVPRLNAGLARVDDGPTTFDLGTQAFPVTAGANESTQTISVDYLTAPPSWTAEDGAALLGFTSRPQNPGVIFYKGPFRNAPAILGDSGAPPAFPQTFDVQYPITEGQRLFLRMRLTRADGRLSPATILNVIVSA